MGKKREPETPDTRKERLRQDAQRAAEVEGRLDAMVKRSITLYGP